LAQIIEELGLGKIRLCKIDSEGAELEILRQLTSKLQIPPCRQIGRKRN
jgi:FkbM family methyltransferase